jgi:hypothetical protein
MNIFTLIGDGRGAWPAGGFLGGAPLGFGLGLLMA